MPNNKETENREDGRIRHIIERQEKVKPWPDPPKETGGEGGGGQGGSSDNQDNND